MISVLKQRPTVRCYGGAAVPGIFESCVSLTNEVDARFLDKKFGAGVDAEVQLPYTQRSSEDLSYQNRYLDS